MKIPGKELVIVLLGLAVLIAVWLLVFTSTQERWRSESAEVRPEGAAETDVRSDAAPESESTVSDSQAETGPEAVTEPAQPEESATAGAPR